MAKVGFSMPRLFKVIGLSLLVGILLIVGIPLLFVRKGGTPNETDFDNEFRHIFSDLTFRYVVRDNSAISKLDSSCRDRPEESKANCVAFVNTIREIDPTLTESLARLDDLLSDPPGSAADEVLVGARNQLNHYTRVHEANQLLLAGWDSKDLAIWKQGWTLRDSLKNDSYAQ
jgi:hypothetical protein